MYSNGWQELPLTAAGAIVSTSYQVPTGLSLMLVLEGQENTTNPSTHCRLSSKTAHFLRQQQLFSKVRGGGETVSQASLGSHSILGTRMSSVPLHKKMRVTTG